MINIKEKLDNITEGIDSFKKLLESIQSLWIFLLPIFGTVLAFFNSDKFKNFLLEHKILSQEVIDVISNNLNGIISGFLVIVILILAIVVYKTGKKKLETKNNINIMISKLHLEFAHKLRDGISSLYLLNERVATLKTQNNADAIKELRGRAYDKLTYDLQHFVDLMAEYLSDYNNDTISVCIKTINPGQDNIDNLEKKAKTLVRSRNTRRYRERIDEYITLGANTDFKHLCDGTNVWYHGVDLKTKYNNREYANEFDANDWQEKYNSTIVVPIRYFDSNNTNELINDILGFICIDSKNIRKEWDEVSPHELHYLAIFADSIYSYIKLFRRLFEEG